MSPEEQPAYSIYDLPDGWQPKSDMWKSIMSKVEFKAKHQKWHLRCPNCATLVGLDVTIQEPRSS